MSLEASNVLEKTINVRYKLTFNYDLMNAVMRIIKEKNIEIVSQKLEMDCQYIISVRKNDSQAIFAIFDNLYKVAIKLEV
jgi:putative IMPACT (imprinted ancient) family translation regulator